MNKNRFVLLALVLVLFVFFFGNSGDGVDELCLLLDLGSAGSRIYIMLLEKGNQVSLFPPGDPHVEKLRPGISSFFPSSIKASDSIIELIGNALQVIRNERGSVQQKIRLYAFATAGLRVLAEKNGQNLSDDDEEDANEVIEEDDDNMRTQTVPRMLLDLRNIITTQYPEIVIPKNGIRIISGTEEGLFGWITIQQLISQGFHIFTQNQSSEMGNILAPPSHSKLSPHRVGAIDFGGASTQITYWVPGDKHDFIPSVDYHQVPQFLKGAVQEGRIYTHSYLHYGIYQSRYLTIDKALQHETSGTIKYPCLLRGSSAAHYDPAVNVILEGTSQWNECVALIHSIFQWREFCKREPCSFNGVHMPHIDLPHSFVAFDYATVIASHFGFHGDSSLNELRKQVQLYCSISWEEAQEDLKRHPERRPLTEERLLWRCFEGAYMIVLFTEGYGFTEDSPHLVFTRELSGGTISWALGAVVHHVN